MIERREIEISMLACDVYRVSNLEKRENNLTKKQTTLNPDISKSLAHVLK